MKPKILIFIDWYKPGFKAGGPIRSISNMVSQLKENYNFYIITRDTDYLESTPYSSIKSNEWNSIDGIKVFYLSTNNLSKLTIKNLIIEIQPDIIYCNSLYSPKFTLTPIRIAKKLNIKTILAVRGMLSEGSLSVKSHKKKVFLTLIKSIGLFNKTIFHATSNIEQNDIVTTFGQNTTVVKALNLPEKKSIGYQPKSKQPNQLKMAFVGRISPEKNTLFAIDILKHCKHNIELEIYGAIYNQEYFEQCNATINQLPKNIVVNYNGVLEHHELDKKLKNYQVVYLPSTGENFGHSIIEGMTNSCVPIISDKTPWQNLEEKNIGFDIDLKHPEKFAKTIDVLAEMDENEFNELTKNSYDYAQSIINDEKLKEEYYKLFKFKN